MGIWVFYVGALIPLVIGGILWLKSDEVTLGEWMGGSAVGFILALVFQLVSVMGMTHDVETWSGYINRVVHYPEWVEVYYITHTVSCGKNCTTTYVTTHYRTHPEYWAAETTIPDEHEISQAFFNEARSKFGGYIETERNYCGGYYSGDHNLYAVYRKTDYLYPVTALRSWSNRVKAAPTLFSFSKVPTNVAVYPWPDNPDWRQSGRLLGTAAATVDLTEFDRMNARLGASKRVNVIMAGFGRRDIKFAEWQRAAWAGGKKNDLVLCYGGLNNGRPEWARVFGWSDSEVCKRNLETLLLDNVPDTKLLALIEQEIRKGYTIKDWSKFDYIRVEPPAWAYWVYGLVMIVSQVGFYWWANNNEFGK